MVIRSITFWRKIGKYILRYSVNYSQVLETIARLAGVKPTKTEVAAVLGFRLNSFSNKKRRGTLKNDILQWALDNNYSLDEVFGLKEPPESGCSLIYPPFINGPPPQEDLAINQAFLDKLGIGAGRAVIVIAPDGSRAHQRIYKGDWIISEKTDVINRAGVYFCREGDIEVMREFQPRGVEFVMVTSLNSSVTTADTYRGEPLARLGVIFARLDGGGFSANHVI